MIPLEMMILQFFVATTIDRDELVALDDSDDSVVNTTYRTA